MFGLGTTELMIIAVIVLILFGSRLPKVMRSLGEGVVEFKKGLQGIEDDVKTNKIEDKPQAKEEVKHSEAETVQK
jgi:TatA/E family protein of Tat protein translocase